MSGRRGFTLIEVAAALTVVACLFIALASLEIVTHEAARGMHTLVLARQVCDDQLARVRQDIQHVPASGEGVTTSDGTEFRWTLAVTEVPIGTMRNGLVRLEITCRWRDEAGPRTLVQRTMMSLPEVVNPPPSPLPSRAPAEGAPKADVDAPRTNADDPPKAGGTP